MFVFSFAKGDADTGGLCHSYCYLFFKYHFYVLFSSLKNKSIVFFSQERLTVGARSFFVRSLELGKTH